MSKVEGQTGVFVGERKPLRERVTDQELGNLVAAIGNHEAKAILLGLMSPHTIYTLPDAHGLIVGAQHPVAWRIDRKGPFDYMSDSFAPIGLVAQEITIRDNLETFGFVKTKKGETLGDTLAGFLLDFSLRYPDISLIDIFGSTQSPSRKSVETDESDNSKKRSPITRIKILWELATVPSSEPVRTSDIAQEIGEDRNAVGNHLMRLSEMGIATYVSHSYGESECQFSLNPSFPKDEKPSQFKGYALATQFVWDAVRQSPDRKWNTESMTIHFAQKTNRQFPLKNISKYISHILRSLATQGYVTEERLFDHNSRSSISLSEQQRLLITDLLTALYRFQQQDSQDVAFGLARLKDIISQPGLVSILLGKAKRHSPHANPLPLEDTSIKILAIIRKNSNITRKEIRELFAAQGDRKLSKNSIARLLLDLVQDKKVIESTEKGVSHYSPSSEH